MNSACRACVVSRCLVGRALSVYSWRGRLQPAPLLFKLEGPLMTATKAPSLEDFLAACVHEHIDVSDEDAYTVAEVLTSSEHLTVRRRIVLSGEWSVVAAALDALPVGAAIAFDDDGEYTIALHHRSYVTGKLKWLETGARGMYDSEHYARHGVPLTVIA